MPTSSCFNASTSPGRGATCESSAFCRSANNSRSIALIASTTSWADPGRATGSLASRRTTNS